MPAMGSRRKAGTSGLPGGKPSAQGAIHSPRAGEIRRGPRAACRLGRGMTVACAVAVAESMK